MIHPQPATPYAQACSNAPKKDRAYRDAFAHFDPGFSG
jgi:hypothetical protein